MREVVGSIPTATTIGFLDIHIIFRIIPALANLTSNSRIVSL